jgi:hypothetical protein
MWGAIHGISHEQHQHHESPAHGDHHHEQATDNPGLNWLDPLFANHEEGSNSCHVYDLQSLSALLSVNAMPGLASLLGVLLPQEGVDAPRAAAFVYFKARAPPDCL